MSLEIVTPTSHDEWSPFVKLIAASFTEQDPERTEEQLVRGLKLLPLDLRIGVTEGGEPLGGCMSYEFQLGMPGGSQVPISGLSAVGIDPTKTGRGGLRTMMTEHLHRTRSRGHAASTLLASESSIYGRFGYGPATMLATYEIASDRAKFAAPLNDPGSLEIVTDVLEALEQFDEVYSEVARVMPGVTSRPREWWEVVLAAKESWLGGGEQLGVLHRDESGQLDGYMLYKAKRGGGFLATDQLQIVELHGANVMAELSLFEFASGVPLTRSVRWTQAPADTPVRMRLHDPRQLRMVDTHDLLWLRPIDVKRLLEARSYRHDGAITFEFADDLFDDQRGPWSLSVIDGAATVDRLDSSASVDLVLTPRQLGTVLLGDTRVAELETAGLLQGDRSALRMLDLLMLTDRRPFTLSKF